LTTLVVNIRYSLMSLALTQKLQPNMSFFKRCIIAFGVTDEIFALASLEKEDIRFPFFGGLMSAPIVGWSLGTFLGAFASGLLPPMLQGCMGIGLYCMFIAIIIPPAKKSKNILIAIAISSILACMFKYIPGINVLSQSGGGWVIIISAITAAAFCATFLHSEQPLTEKTLKPVEETVKNVKLRR
ncbi:MAG: AzlC family ABC transporter permease, partial [Bacteroidales bacterium]|nr:AzlC family ABC transporter permease [Bacteroidales bacterium]